MITNNAYMGQWDPLTTSPQDIEKEIELAAEKVLEDQKRRERAGDIFGNILEGANDILSTIFGAKSKAELQMEEQRARQTTRASILPQNIPPEIWAIGIPAGLIGIALLMRRR